jgi:hypothetical protein
MVLKKREKLKFENFLDEAKIKEKLELNMCCLSTAE